MGGVGSKPETLPPIAYDKDGKQLGRCSIVMCALCVTCGRDGHVGRRRLGACDNTVMSKHLPETR